jgi:uncharacterized membrane protein (GlpM family)
MDWVWKALLTAGSVLLVMLLARHGGRRAAGAVAAMPTVTAPALAWLAHDRGDAFAANAAVASLAACAMLAAFAVVQVHVAQRRGVVGTLACGAVGAAMLAAPAALASATLAAALPLAASSCALALLCLPSPPPHALPPARAPIVATALAAAGLGLVTAALAPLLGIFAAGLLASLPLVSGAVAVSEQASAGYAGVAPFLRGYVRGLPARAVFCVAFALLAVPVGWIAASAVAALLSGAVGLLLQRTPWPSARKRVFDIPFRANRATE